MELSLVISALKKRWWLVLIFATLGALPGTLSDSNRVVYRTGALLLVSPTSGTNTGGGFANNPDRYVANQLSILQSRELASQVAAQIGLEDREGEVHESTTIEQQPETDVVTVSVEHSDPQTAQQIAQGYIDVYIEGIRARAETSAAPDVARLDDRLDAIYAELTTINAGIQDTYANWVVVNPELPIPPLDLLSPDAASRRGLLVDEAARLVAQRNDLQLLSLTEITSEVIQEPTLPRSPLGASRTSLTIAGYALGAMVGIAAAVMWARFSAYALDDIAVSEIVGRPVVGSIPYRARLARDPRVAFDSLPGRLAPVIDQLTVRAEALGQVGEPLRVAVVGTRRGAGTTTIALALASRFALRGPTTLVDLDAGEPGLTPLFNAGGHPGVKSIIDELPSGLLAGDEDISLDPDIDRFSSTGNPNVRLLGLGAASDVIARSAVAPILDHVCASAPVAVVDGGPALHSASTVELCAKVDAIVLCIPRRRQRISELEDIARQLSTMLSHTLPVVTTPLKRRWRRGPAETALPALSADITPGKATETPSGDNTTKGDPEPAPAAMGESAASTD